MHIDGHDYIFRESMKTLNLTKEEINKINHGLHYPDLMCGEKHIPNNNIQQKHFKLCKLIDMVKIVLPTDKYKSSSIYQSHRGRWAIGHSTSPTCTFTCAQVRREIIERATMLYYLAEQDYTWLGILIHMVQDSYSPTHTLRNVLQPIEFEESKGEIQSIPNLLISLLFDNEKELYHFYSNINKLEENEIYLKLFDYFMTFVPAEHYHYCQDNRRQIVVRLLDRLFEMTNLESIGELVNQNVHDYITNTINTFDETHEPNEYDIFDFQSMANQTHLSHGAHAVYETINAVEHFKLLAPAIDYTRQIIEMRKANMSFDKFVPLICRIFAIDLNRKSSLTGVKICLDMSWVSKKNILKIAKGKCNLNNSCLASTEKLQIIKCPKPHVNKGRPMIIILTGFVITISVMIKMITDLYSNHQVILKPVQQWIPFLYNFDSQ